MSITSQVCKHIYLTDGQTRDFEIDFPVLSAQDVAVYCTASDGTETKITENYAVHLMQGTVEYPTLSSGLDPVAAGCKITLVRTTPLTQELTLTQQGVLDAKALEGGYDKITLQLQEVAEQLKRCIKYRVSSANTDEDAAAFLAQLQATQTAALNNALASVEEVKNTLLQSMSDETTARTQADLTLQQSVQTLAGTVSSNDSTQTAALTAESTTRQSADNDLQAAVSAEAVARLAADNALAEQISQLHFIEFVATLPTTGNSHYIYAVPQEETDLDNHPIIVLYVWQSEWKSVGAFSTNLDPDSLLTKTEAASTYLTQTSAAATYLPSAQKAAANGVASLDANAKVTAAQIPYATAASIGGIKQSFDGTTNTWTVVTEDL